MADSPARFVEQLLDPVEPFLDRLFLAGVVYGSWNALRCTYCALRSFRNYLLPIGATPVTTERLGEWAGVIEHYITHPFYIYHIVVTGATTGLGKAFALDVSCNCKQTLHCDMANFILRLEAYKALIYQVTY